MTHEQLTIVAIYGHNDGASAIPALLKSQRELPGSRAMLISPIRPKKLPKGIKWKHCFPLDYYGYSVFCIHCLHHYIKTDYCLIVQDDSWVLNGANFTAKYYEYDYVGAPANAALVGDEYFIDWMWLGKEGAIEVQNGGFSLRSKRFLEACSRHGLTYIPSERKPFGNEDVQLTAFRRRELEAVGMKFAPLEVAKQFSVEYMGPGFHDDFNFEGLVGCHGHTRKLIAEDTIYIKQSMSMIQMYYREVEFLFWLQSKGYSIQFAAETDEMRAIIKERIEQASRAVPA